MKRVYAASDGRLSPGLYFVGMLAITIVVVGDIVRGGGWSFSGLFFLCVALAANYFLIRLRSYGLVDEVWDGGDHLLVRMGQRSERVPLADIEEVTESAWGTGRTTLRLVRPGPCGSAIVFVAPSDFMSSVIRFAKTPYSDDLTDRVERARNTS